MNKPFVRSPYNYDRNEASKDASLFFDLDKFPDRTVQSQKDEADINVIMRKFGVTGVAPMSKRAVLQGDFEDIFDFQSAMNAIRSAEIAFGALDADLRMRFNNDPQRYLEFCDDPKNKDEMIKLGIAIEPPKVDDPKPMKVEVVNPVKAKKEDSRGEIDIGN